TLAGSIADRIRHQRKSTRQGIYPAGLSRAEFHDYLRLLVHRCFRIDRGAHLSGAAADTPNKWSSHDCFEEAVRSPVNLRVVLYRAPDSPDDPQDPNDKSIGAALDAMREEIFYELGLRVPQVVLREDKLLRRNEVRLQINDVRLPPMQGLGVHELLINETVEELSLLNIQGRKAVNPISGNESAIVHGSDEVVEACKQGNYTTSGRNEYTALVVGEQLRKFAGSLIVLGTVEYELHRLKNASTELVDIVEARFGVNSIVRFLRYLAEEEISFRNLRGILEALLATSTSNAIDFAKNIVFNPYAMCVTPMLNSKGNEADDVRTYAEAIRSNLKRYISHKYTQEQGKLVVYLIDPQIELSMKEAGERSLTEDEREHVLNALEQELGNLPASAQNPVILTSIDLRRDFKDLIAIEFPKMSVLSYQELSPDLTIQPIARISFG
ncbi:MAG: FHIPEP family type III secretion protein, partial [Acidobacteriota bacterium]|nr:FHIPEP family type III secretion protein [Acidobacteriota bacterium]